MYIYIYHIHDTKFKIVSLSYTIWLCHNSPFVKIHHAIFCSVTIYFYGPICHQLMWVLASPPRGGAGGGAGQLRSEKSENLTGFPGSPRYQVF